MGRRLAFSAAWAILAVPVALPVFRAGEPGDRSPVWDVASHALNGLRLSDAIAGVRPLAFLEELVIPHHYPPGHSILQAPFFLAMGRSWAAPRAASAAALVVLVFLAAWLAQRAGSDDAFGTVAVVAAVASSPRLLLHAAVPMLEIFAALGFVFFALMYARSLEAPQDVRRASWAGAAAAMVYLTTVNYGVILFAAVAAYELLRGDVRAGARAAREFGKGYRPLNVWTVAALLSLVVAVIVKLTGGWKGSWGSVQSVRAPVSVAAGILAVHLGVELWKRRDAVRRWPPRLKGFFWATVVPLVVWFAIYPPRFRTTLDFLEGGGATPMTLEDRFLLYPRAWIGEYHLSAALGVASVLALVVTLATWKRQKEAARVAAVLAAVATAAVFAHPMRDLRFLVGVLPLYWILLASQIGTWAGKRWYVSAAAGLALAATALPARRLHRESLAPRIISTWYADPGSARLVEFAARGAGEVSSMRLIGTAPGISWHAVEFEVRRVRRMGGFRFAKDIEHTAKTGKSAREIFDRWVAKAEERVITVEGPPGPEATWGDTKDERAYVDLVETCGRFRLVREDATTVPGIRVRVWDRSR
ncbi:MAG: hypothetical protein HYY17_03740 [Planctomycetes bacterium]|nr:hypothetical protein [Planctomycetota bacterium]